MVAVAGRYAKALADLAGRDTNLLESLASEIDLLARVVGTDARLLEFLASAKVPRERKEELLSTLAKKAKLSDLAQRFVRVLVDNGRVAALPDIAVAFGEIKDAATGILPAETTVAVSLTEEEQAALRAALEKMTGRKVRLSVKVDPEVLGGARTRIGSRVYDGTLRNRLETLRRRLSAAR
jgi:F-type H+-transporting ATPase subunit delta